MSKERREKQRQRAAQARKQQIEQIMKLQPSPINRAIKQAINSR